MKTNNFWSTDINISSQSNPKMLMKKLAADLGIVTKNIVEADITTAISNGIYIHCFVLIAPLLNYERINLLCINETIASSNFHLTIISSFDNKQQNCYSMDEFEECLKQILSSKEVTQIINSLIAQSS